jgi:hypothetical protein
MTDEPPSSDERSRPEGPGSSQHEIERAVRRLNEWFTEHKRRIPRCFDGESLGWVRHVPVFKAVRTTAIKDWTVADLSRLFRVGHREVCKARAEVEVPVELLVADKSLRGTFLDAQELMKAAFRVITGRHLLGRFNPRLRWFWTNSPLFTLEIDSYVSGIRLRVDAQTPVQHDQRRVFEDFNVPLQNGQQTAIGKSCMFVLEHVEAKGTVPHWRFSLTQNGEVIVQSQPLRVKPIYHKEELLAVIKRIDETAVTLSVLTSEGG